MSRQLYWNSEPNYYVPTKSQPPYWITLLFKKVLSDIIIQKYLFQRYLDYYLLSGTISKVLFKFWITIHFSFRT